MKWKDPRTKAVQVLRSSHTSNASSPPCAFRFDSQQIKHGSERTTSSRVRWRSGVALSAPFSFFKWARKELQVNTAVKTTANNSFIFWQLECKDASCWLHFSPACWDKLNKKTHRHKTREKNTQMVALLLRALTPNLEFKGESPACAHYALLNGARSQKNSKCEFDAKNESLGRLRLNQLH